MAEETAMALWLQGSGSGSGGNGSDSCPHQGKMYAQWVLTVFGQCIGSPLQYAAFFIGLSSIICWLLAQAPQMVTNCRYGIADKALSFWFLLQWFLGDATNLIGAVLTHQLATQTATAAYFVLIDTLMMAQFLYYLLKNQGLKGLTSCCYCPHESKILAIFLPGLMCTMLFASWPYLSSPLLRDMAVGGALYSSEHRTGRVLLSDSGPVINVHDPKELSGYIFGCLSAALYVGSRIPQILKNFIRCSVDGVSLPMFILAVLGNVTYALGIFLYSHDKRFLIQKLPWLVGSIGTLCFDFTIFFQFFFIRVLGGKYCRGTVQVEVGDEEETTPLLSNGRIGREESGLPCFESKGSIQAQQSAYLIESSSTSDGSVDELITSHYDLPHHHQGHCSSGHHEDGHHSNQ